MLDRLLRQRYKIIEHLGSGGFGDTYRAIDLDFPNQPLCVVKHFLPKNSHPEALAIAQRLFDREAECLSKLGENTAIPRLYAYLEEEGEFFLVQELIEGHNLTQEFQLGQKWSEAETVNFLRELLEILAFVHQNNTIHRDIKPANIMRRSSDNKLVLIDFGAVKEVLTVDKEGKTDITIGIGTGAYMAPEQARGKPGKYSDVYAVGMLGIQALTGLSSRELPQDADKFKEILTEEQIQISPQLEYVLSKMISFQPDNRFADANEALKAFIPTSIEPSETDVTSPAPQRKLPLILLGIIGVTGSVFLGWKVINRPDLSQLETYLAKKQWQQADTETDKLILKIAGEDNALDSESSNKIPCKSLQKIDELWMKNSNKHFGFTSQTKAFLETGNNFDEYIESNYEAFGNKISWRFLGAWKRYKDFNFKAIDPTITLSGNLPSPGIVAADKQDLRWREREMLLSRFNACQLNN
jgi:eukaryotic-like serine/threonine-protein kinase